MMVICDKISIAPIIRAFRTIFRRENCLFIFVRKCPGEMKYLIAVCVGLLFIGVQSHPHNSLYWRTNMSRRCVAKHTINESAISQSTLVPLADKINQRLGHMKDVAGYKAENHLPIEDVEQESKVINASLTEAESLGLDRESVRPFIIAQISAAKAIQYRYRAQWLAVSEEDWQPQPLDVVRQKIAELSSEILQQLALQAKTGPIQDTEHNAFVLQLDQDNLSCPDKWRLFEALLLVRSI